ncbi:MAG TPA: hypothetical protein VIY48_00820 [Candidatus Paceibacterota bacterium]
MGVLRNINDERFCQLVVSGREPGQAYLDTGGTSKTPEYAADRRMRKPVIRKRIEELLDVGARKAMLSRSQILQRIFEDWETSRKLGQMAAAATNAKMMGSELHRMFVDRKEVGGPGDFDAKTPEELMEYIKGELKELGVDARDVTNALGIKIEDDNQAITLIPPLDKAS